MFLVASARITRLTIAPLLAFWIAGAGCLFGCEVKVLAAEHQPANVVDLMAEVSGEACASSSAGHSCCARENANKQSSSFSRDNSSDAKGLGVAILPGNPSGSMSGCPFAVNDSVLVGKRSGTEAVATNSAEVVPKQLEPLAQVTYLPNRLRLANRGHTYLLGCVFLI
ncbi:MAG TPA: hypothetical protein VIB00_14675 [Pyrinomonadaceae bacterium]|jgi:hypothetical protein